MSRLLVGIDLGSQSAKVTAYDLDGAVAAHHQTALRPTVSPGPGLVEHPDDDLWDALTAASSATMSLLGDRREEVVAIGLCGIRCCRALLRADGSLGAPVMSWMDARVTGPHRQDDDAVAWVTASSGYLTHRLTGRFRDSAAAYTDPWPVDARRGVWDPERTAGHGVRPGQLVELVRPGEELGRVTPEAAAATGLPTGLPVLATANDKAVEALGCGVLDATRSVVSLGTYIAGMTVAEAYQPPRASCWTNPSCVPGSYLFESAGIRRGMWTVSWLRDLVGRSEDDLNDAAARVPPGSEGLLTVLDWLAPPDQSWRRGALVGLDGRHGAAHLYRSVLEGIAVTMAENVGAMTTELGRHQDGVVVSGGGARSDLMLQVMADAFGSPATRTTGPSAVSRGAAACAGVGVGVYADFEDACARLVSTDRTVEPTAEGTRVYAALRPVRRQLREDLSGTLTSVQALLG